MKAIHCLACNSLHSLKADKSVTSCDCGKVKGWYQDADNGIAMVTTSDPSERSLAQIISFHNGYLNDGATLIPHSYYDHATQQQIPYREDQRDEFWRVLHTHAGLTPKAPETVRIFDQGRRACPMAIIEPGTTVDAVWMDKVP